jgi:uncharacterized integral membrane protein
METGSERTSLERMPEEAAGSAPDAGAADPGPAGTPESAVPVRDAVDAPPPTAEHVTPTRISASWTAVVAAVVLLIVLVVFIAENTQSSTVNFVGFHGHAPTAVVLLISVIAGAVIVIIVGTARILQLRKVARHSESLPRGRS